MCHLFYPPGHIPGQQPRGFRFCSDIGIFVPEGMNWHLAKRSLGAVNAGVCRYIIPERFQLECANESSTGLKIAFMALTDAGERSLEDDFRIPENMIYTRALDRTFDLQRPLAPPMLNSFTQLLGQSIQTTKQSVFVGENRPIETEQKIHVRAVEKQITARPKRIAEENEPGSTVSTA